MFSLPAVLGPSDLLAVLTELLEVRADWYMIGLALNLTSGTLDAMKGPRREHKDCMVDMVKEWLSTSPDPSWKSLIEALRHPVVDKHTLSNHLEAKYCTPAAPQGKLGQNCKPDRGLYVYLKIAIV